MGPANLIRCPVQRHRHRNHSGLSGMWKMPILRRDSRGDRR